MNWLRSFIYRQCRRPQALWTTKGSEPVPASGILVLSKHPNPTFSYYLEERIAALAGLSVVIRDIDEPLEGLDPGGLFVIVCRYIKPRQLRWLEAHRHRISGVAYFVDDDMAAVIAGPEAGWEYKWKLVRLALGPLRRLNPMLSDVWASTEALASALGSDPLTITVLPPYPPENLAVAEPAADHRRELTMIYHATGIHRQEHAFLIPIVETAMRKYENLCFAVIANGEIARWWRNSAIDKRRLTISRALSWNDYLRATSGRQVDISLVPLLEGRVNNARSDTKRIDISRSGAAAIFSRCATYQRCAMPGEFHVMNTANDWDAAIDALVQGNELRMAARDATRKSIALMREIAPLQFPGLCFEAAAVRKRS
jgi:hypothetical protein